MNIKRLKINGFGKLQDKDIELNNGLNIVYGKNEAGKSTLLKFIIAMFYGISKNKNGQKLPDKEKFTPWEAEEFSGKISYSLDSGDEFEVYRDFRKSNPKIFNHAVEEISKTFTIDKTKGNQFFSEQTGIEENIFTTSVISKQGEVKLDGKSQSNLVQKISNLLGTGEDTNSYEKIVAKLRKKLNDEVGTSHTKEKPWNIVEKRIEQLTHEKEKLAQYQISKFEMEEQQEEVRGHLIAKKEKLESLKLANIQIEKLASDAGKAEGMKQLEENIEKEIQALKQEEPVQKVKQEVSMVHKVIAIVLFILSVAVEILVPILAIKVVAPVILVVWITYLAVLMKKHKKELQNNRESKKEYQNKLTILQDSKQMQQAKRKQIEATYQKKKKEIEDTYHITPIENLPEEMSITQSSIHELTLKLHTLALDNQEITEKLERYVALEEELESLQEEKKELEWKRAEIQKVLEVMGIAYTKMKQEVTPKFTEKLSSVIRKVSNGKYQKVRMNINGAMMVEQANGEYIDADNLSMGTIDQLYLALRLATIEEITKEKMPIILDEAFAYYDTERMANILSYLVETYPTRQIIVLTCSKREIELLDKAAMPYHLITL